MKLEFGPAEQPERQRAPTRKAFSRFKSIAEKAALGALASFTAFSFLVPKAAQAAEIPSAIVWTTGVDWYKQAVRDDFRSKGFQPTKYANQQELPLGQMVDEPFSIRDPITGMAYSLKISQGFFYAGGDSLKYRRTYYSTAPEGAIRDRAYTWEIAKYGSAPHRDVRWSSSHPSYVPNTDSRTFFRFMASQGTWSADLTKYYDPASGTFRDTNAIAGAGPSYQFCHAWNYGEGNWGGRRKWLGVSSVDLGQEGVTFYDFPPEAAHPPFRPIVFPIPKPGGSGLLSWVCDAVFWKVPPGDTTSPYDLKARVDSARFIFAELDNEQRYVAGYPLQQGETDTVVARPYDVFRLPVPARLVPFRGYNGRKGELADPWYQLSNISAPFLGYEIHGLVVAPMEVVFYQDSTAKCGPWYTRMRGRIVNSVTFEGVTDNGPQFLVDSLVMERYVRLPRPGDTTFITMGDEYSKEFRVPDQYYGANYPFDPLLIGFLSGRGYATTGSGQGTGFQGMEARNLAHVSIKNSGSCYELRFGGGEAHAIAVYDLQGKQLHSSEARGSASLALPHSGMFVLSIDGAKRIVSSHE